MQLDLGRDPAVLDLEADPAVQVVGDRGDDEDDDEGREQPVHDEGQERQAEDVEADVLTPNCGSFTPKRTALLKSSHSFHWLDAGAPAMKPSSREMPIRTSQTRRPTISR